MSLNNSLTARLDELRSRNQSRMTSENNQGPGTPLRYSGSFMTNTQQAATASTENPGLQRRFTADLSKMAAVAPIGQQSQGPNPEITEFPAIVSLGCLLIFSLLHSHTYCLLLNCLYPLSILYYYGTYHKVRILS